ncbi:MAG: hypothetical protein CM15mP84_07320 [Cellvibrionales bacterium]|nr:MAG: hypothetical protein CM15mP84_07320 [Cellvibrionales bacterium]
MCRSLRWFCCGQCASCRAFGQGVHGDFCGVRRSDGKVSIGIDQIRQATQALQQTPLYGSIKVVLIEAADQMTLAAANSLLKILRNPRVTRCAAYNRGNVAVTTNRAVEMPAVATASTQCGSSKTLAGDRAGMDAETLRRALQLADGKVISSVTLERAGALSA